MIFAALLLAAIITERNDLYTKTADYATFGTNTSGIAEAWIPYGTFTDGYGGVEYLRVTSNLIGVVASVYDGEKEREQLPNEVMPEDMGGVQYIYYPPPQITNHYSDSGVYLETTNNTLRILDGLNATRYIFYTIIDDVYDYDVGEATDPVEVRLARTDSDSTTFYNGGLATFFGGRKLDGLVDNLGASINPPIPGVWTTNLPFKIEDSAAWLYCWPTYISLTNDIHFFLVEAGKTRTCEHCFFDWTNPNHLVDVWGNDVNDAAQIVVEETSTNCLPLNMENVLSADTGWKYEPRQLTNDFWTVHGVKLVRATISGRWDDLANADYADWSGYDESHVIFYNIHWENPSQWICSAISNNLEIFRSTENEGPTALIINFGSGYLATKTELYSGDDDYAHWRNMTKRLDWKRLGIVCQLERQMEQTYRARDDEDYLPFIKESGSRENSYVGTLENIPLTTILDEDFNPIIVTTNFNAENVTFSLSTQIVNQSTNNLGWCFPTARLINCNEFGDIAAREATSVPVYIGESAYLAVLDSIASSITSAGSFTNGWLVFIVGGSFVASHYSNFNWFWENNSANFIPQSGDSTVWDPGLSGTDSFSVTPFGLTNVSCRLFMTTGKLAATSYTDAAPTSTIITNLVHYPSTNIWSREWVALQDRPSLEVMLDSKGFEIKSFAEKEDDSTMPWDNINGSSNQSQRVFRMSPLAAGMETVDLSDMNRWEMLYNLDAEVKARFETLAGLQVVGGAANLANFAFGEEAAIKRQLQSMDLRLQLSLSPAFPGNGSLVAVAEAAIDGSGFLSPCTILELYFMWYDTSSQEWYRSDLVKESSSYLTGSFSFGEDRKVLTNEVITVKPVRVDGHQDQMIKTLWRFKNLRDPTL